MNVTALTALVPLDRARGAALHAAAPLARPFLRDRGLRVAAYAAIAIAAAFALTCAAPLALLAIGPILLGVPHLLADARYLVARPRLHERAAFWIAIAAPATLVWSFPRLWVGLLATAGAGLVARTSLARRAAFVAATLGLTAAAYATRGAAEIVFAHAHNLIALGMWAAFFRAPDGRGAHRLGAWRRTVVVGLFAVCSLALLAGAVPTSVLGSGHADAAALAEQLRALAPPGAGAFAPRLVLFFAFAQSVHYALWVRVVPEEDRPRPGVRSFAASARALLGDMGAPVVLAFLALGLFVLAWAFVDLHAARLGYLRLALTHGHLETAIAALWALEGRSSPVASRLS